MYTAAMNSLLAQPRCPRVATVAVQEPLCLAHIAVSQRGENCRATNSTSAEHLP